MTRSPDTCIQWGLGLGAGEAGCLYAGLYPSYGRAVWGGSEQGSWTPGFSVKQVEGQEQGWGQKSGDLGSLGRE